MAPWIVTALDVGLRESPTMARLVDAVEASPVIVHIQGADGERRGWDGRIQFVASSASWLYVRVEVRRHAPPTTAALIAHELQHALEMVAAGVRTAAEFDELYRRIGVRNPSNDELYDTPAAVAAGERTLREIGVAAALSSRLGARLRTCASARCPSR